MKQLPIIERAMAHGERIAVCSATGTTTYGDLVAASESAAATLLAGADDLNEARIAYLVPAGEGYIQTQWGIWRAGGIAVPLSTSATEKELEYTLTDSQTSTVIATSELIPRLTSLCKQLDIRLLSVDDVPSTPTARLPEISTERRAMILYTSGTTSKPKGVVTTHACIQAQIESLVDAWRWQQDDRIPLFLPLHHIHGIINIMSCALWSGAQLETFPRFDLDTVLGRVADHAYTVFMAVPTIYVKVIEALEAMPSSECDPIVQGFADMRLMISGSAALPASVHEKWSELTGQKLLERYGMTEIGMALSNPYDGERRPGAVGQPLPGVEIRLQDECGESITNEGVSGEIQVRGPNVFQQYWNRPDATSESFVDGWFRTGDMAVIENDYFRIMGRSSVDIIKSGGYKLSALEIEASLLDHPAITQCAIVGLPDDTWGEAVAAAVVLKHSQALELESLRGWCKDRISPYKIPRKLLVVEELPRNAMGKVTKPAVSQLFNQID
ncbi:Long-chain-fatty-acid--CoA ligase [Novipirellula galeiformis]|uniref:Long-chain-fatty-acid--CoA ligase n=1 Tax=Novipirellula galeiformis TaxID=2528004 RepID=A0A5C6CL86_9BACT|nr:acyl-CoA synthetase [Novipirellula galeiformis]TWU24835.1 Long-chain-fatty-acid--CoA ligase [Novipirellula galeiformis]